MEDEVEKTPIVERPINTKSVDPLIIICGLFLIFVTLSLIRYVFFVFSVWSLALGISLGYALLLNYKELPDFTVLVSIVRLLQAKPSLQSKSKDEKEKVFKCTVCDSSTCERHRPEVTLESLHPWQTLQLPKPVDQALTEFLEVVLQTHVYSWYWELSHDQGFVDELRVNLRYSLSIILQRVKKLDLSQFLLKNCLKKFMAHYDFYCRFKAKARPNADIQANYLAALGPHKHFAIHDNATETEYLRYVVELILPHLVRPALHQCKTSQAFLRELLSVIIIQPVASKVTDPDFINDLILILLDENPLVERTEPSSQNVVFLAEFGKPRLAHSSPALKIPAYDLIHDPSLLFPFMQFMKREGSLKVLQFCLAVEDFNKRILALDVTDQEEENLVKEVKDIFLSYFDVEAIDRINFPPDVIEDFMDAISTPKETLLKLRTSAPLFRAYEHSFNILENTFVPLFYESDEFFSIVCGDRDPHRDNGELSRMKKKKFMPLAELSKIANKIKAKKQAAKDDKALSIFLDEYEQGTTPEDVDSGEEEMEPLLQGSGCSMDEDYQEVRDLSYWHVTIPRVEYVLDRNKKIYVFLISVECIAAKDGMRHDERWQLLRKYNEFYVLDSKLRRFHESAHQAELPAKRTIFKKDLDYLNSCRLPLQEYLQALVRNPVLRTSGLLHSFLSPGSEITGLFEPESVGKGAGRKLKSMTSKLTFERGQNLEPFLQAFISSAEPVKKKVPPKQMPDNIGLIKHKKTNSKVFLPPPRCLTPQGPLFRCVPALIWAAAAGQVTYSGMWYRSRSFASAIMDAHGRYVFSVWQLNQQSMAQDRRHKRKNGKTENQTPETVFDYIVYAARNIFKVPSWIHHLLITIQYVAGATINSFTKQYLTRKIRLATDEDQMVDLIHLLRDAIFFDSDSPRTDNVKLERRSRTHEAMLRFFPERIQSMIGMPNHYEAITMLFELLQQQKLNQQLVFNLLDELVYELFPEVKEKELRERQSSDPKR